MASITCGECKYTHASVEEVKDCYDHANDPVEVSCFSCDGLIGYYDPESERNPWRDASGEQAGCGGPGICRRDFPATFGPGAY